MLRLFDTLTRRQTELRPRKPDRVSIYACGPTVYDAPHLGHARTAVTYDVLCRYLTWRGFEVDLVSNITDIDDKIIARAAAEGETEAELAKRFEDVYLAEMRALGVGEPRVRPRATEYVEEMVGFIGKLLEQGAAYVIPDGGVYFEVSKYSDYGRLPHRSMDDLRAGAGARVEVDERKRDPLDFALWKAAKRGEPAWDSPWMPGRPGWHIECVAMSLELLGDGFDIHGGGSDLIFPHHENERAEAEAAGHRFARIWMHSAMVNVDGEKMAKSAGNFRTLGAALSAYGQRALRLAFLQSHYRSTMEIDDAVLAGAASAAERIDALGRRLLAAGVRDGGEVTANPEKPPTSPSSTITEETRNAFIEAMNSDLSTPAALAAVFDALRKGNVNLDDGKLAEAKEAHCVVKELSGVLGIPSGTQTITIPAPTESPSDASVGDSIQNIERLVSERKEARRDGDYAAADSIREELRKVGIELEDTPTGETLWRAARRRE